MYYEETFFYKDSVCQVAINVYRKYDADKDTLYKLKFFFNGKERECITTESEDTVRAIANRLKKYIIDNGGFSISEIVNSVLKQR